jgi:hypothetical protein
MIMQCKCQNASLTPRVLHISSYSTRSKVQGVSGQHCVSVVVIHCLLADAPYILGHVVDRGWYTPIESFVVHSPNIGQVGSSYKGSLLCS